LITHQIKSCSIEPKSRLESAAMGHIDVSGVEYALSDGRVLLNDVSFRVGDGAKVALIGPNGSGKTTLIRMICGDISPDEGTVAITGGLGVMRQFHECRCI
jgi:ABC-type multidrug transport system ATPase subunit